MKDANATIAEKRLDDNVTEFAPEGFNLGHITADQGRRDKIRKMGDEQFFRCIPHFHRIIHHKRFRVQVLKQMRCGDILHVKRGILPHQNDITGGKLLDAFGAEIDMIADLIAQGDIMAAGKNAVGRRFARPDLHPDRFRAIDENLVTPLLRFERQCKSGIAANINRVDRVHLNGDKAPHGSIP